MKNFKLTKTIILAQTNLEINTEKVFASISGIEFFKTTDNQGFVLKTDYLSNVRNCLVFGNKLHSILVNSMVEISK
jgi:4-diphosphocytidyl-2C-methyl-D-erythritol kinase